MCRHCRPYIDINNPQGMQLDRFKNRTPARFEYIYCTLFPLCHSNQDMYPFLKDASFCPCFCFVHTIAQFSRILRFSYIYCQIFRIYKDPRLTEVTYHCINFNDRVRKAPKIKVYQGRGGSYCKSYFHNRLCLNRNVRAGRPKKRGVI